jgi:hypothetical protein
MGGRSLTTVQHKKYKVALATDGYQEDYGRAELVGGRAIVAGLGCGRRRLHSSGHSLRPIHTNSFLAHASIPETTRQTR